MSRQEHGLIGRIIGHFIVRELLGRGGMASVYRAEHRILAHQVALKILHDHYIDQKTMVYRFMNEARSVASIQHPGIVAIHDVGRTRDRHLYTVMELLVGESLGERLDNNGQLSEARALKICRQIASALAEAHACGVIHRDIKPDNIFLVADPEVPGGERIKVLDFGIAKAAGMDHNELTAVGVVIGTPSYMAPEQCTPNAEVDGRADIYSLGALMYRMVTGKKPFVADDDIQLLRNHLHVTPATPVENGAAISLEFDNVIMTCLEKDPGARFQSMAELADRLAELEKAVEISGPLTAPYAEQPTIPGTLVDAGPGDFAAAPETIVDETGIITHRAPMITEPIRRQPRRRVVRELTEVEIDVEEFFIEPATSLSQPYPQYQPPQPIQLLEPFRSPGRQARKPTSRRTGHNNRRAFIWPVIGGLIVAGAIIALSIL